MRKNGRLNTALRRPFCIPTGNRRKESAQAPPPEISLQGRRRGNAGREAAVGRLSPANGWEDTGKLEILVQDRQQLGHLRPGQFGAGIQLSVLIALEEVLGHGPGDGSFGIGGDPTGIGEAG